MKIRIPSISLLIIILYGCTDGNEQTSAYTTTTPVILDAAVSANGIAVGSDLGKLHVNDGGNTREVTIDGIVHAVAPADTGVWAVTNNEVVFVRADGEDRYSVEGFPIGILPAGDGTAYVITIDALLFVGSGDHRAAQRRLWSRYSAEESDEISHNLEQEAGGGDIHRYDP